MLNQEKMQVLLEGRDKLSPAMREAAQSVQAFDQRIQGLQSGIAALVGVGGLALVAQQAARVAVDMAKVNTEVQRATFAFNHFSGGANTAAMNLRAVQDASGGALDSLQAMQLATTIMTQGLADSADGLSRITRIAKGVAAVSPVINDVDSAVGQLSLTIANTSWQRLDQLGTSAGEVKAAMAALGAEYSNLSEAQRFEIALLDTLEGKLGPVADAAENQASGLEKLGRAWRDYYQVLSQGSGFVNVIASNMADALDETALRANIATLRSEFGKMVEAGEVSGGQWSTLMDLFQAYDEAKRKSAGGAFLDEDIGKLNDLIDRYYAVGAAIEQAAATDVPLPGADYFAPILEAAEGWQPDQLWSGVAEGAAEAAVSMRDVGQAVTESTAEFERATTVTEILEGRWQTAGKVGAQAADEFKQQLTDLVFKLADAGFSAQQIIDLMPDLEAAAANAGQSAVAFGENTVAAFQSILATGQGVLSLFGQLQLGAANTISSVLSGLAEVRSDIERSAQSQAVNLVDKVGQENAFAFYNDSVNAATENWAKLNAAVHAGTMTQAEANIAHQAYMRSLDDEILAQHAAAQQIEKRTAAVGGMSAEYSNLQSKVASLISGAIGPVAGVDANDLLPREDAVNENARRLADIAVNGLKGQDWLGEFASEVPGIFDEIANSANPQEAAARILRDFQDGLRPELIDTERAKELVLRAIKGDENTSALIQQVAQDIAREQGIALETAQAAAQQVLGGGAEGGASPVAKSLELDEKRAEDAGEKTGKSYGMALVGAFRENVPIELIEILTLKVTPEVLAQIQSESSRGGAQ